MSENLRRPLAWLARMTWVLAACLFVAGCQDDEPIASYEVARTEPRVRSLDVADVRDQLDHMFVAVVPQGDKAWFFKVVTPGKDANDLRQPFEDFLKTVSISEAGARPNWKLPEGWTEKGGDKMRSATIAIPHKEADLELSVSQLPLKEAWASFLEQNVNRWMDQLGEEPLASQTIGKLARAVPFEGGEATEFELVGIMQRKGGAMPPGHPPVAAPATDDVSAETAKADDASPPSRQSSDFNFQTPPGWEVLPANPPRRATFRITSGTESAEVSVLAFPATASMADPLENAKRWAAQADATNISDEGLRQALTDVKVSGIPGQFFELLGAKDAAAPKGVVAAMVQRSQNVWFFKLSGPRNIVEGEREAFRTFLDSVHFNGSD